jgi:hypothetical protein
LVANGFYKATLEEGYMEYLKQPIWFILNLLKEIRKQDRNKINLISSTTARVAILLEQGFSSFSSQGGRDNIRLDDYLPFKSETDDFELLEQDTIDIYWECVKDGAIPDYVAKVFKIDKKVGEILMTGEKK